MMQPYKLFMIMLGCKPAGRHTEQHDIFFTVGRTLKETIPGILDFWPEAKEKIHVDAWREVTEVNGYLVEVIEKSITEEQQQKLFFINLGGYKQGEFDEPHYKMVVVAPNLADATRQAKESAFYRHTGFSGATSHIDDKYGVDVDDIFEIMDILPKGIIEAYSLRITKAPGLPADDIHLGYFPLGKIKD